MAEENYYSCREISAQEKWYEPTIDEKTTGTMPTGIQMTSGTKRPHLPKSRKRGDTHDLD